MVRTRPRANQADATLLTRTTTQFDSLGRTLSVGYDDGITPSKSFFYDSVLGGQGWTQSVSNARGRLVATSSGSGGTLARSLMSYDGFGHVTTLWECAPSICGGSNQSSRPAVQTQYDLAGFLTYDFDGASGGIRYGRSPAGEITSVTNETYHDQINPGTLVSNGVNSPFGALTYQLGNGLYTNQVYDSMGRLGGRWVCQGTNSAFCGGGGQLYGNLEVLHGSRVTSICDTINNQCQDNGYDEFNRLASISAQPFGGGATGSYTYSYDRYGNRTSQISVNGGPVALLHRRPGHQPPGWDKR